MRITNSMMINNLKQYMSQNLLKTDKYQQNLSTGSTINRPSDNPAGIVKSLQIRTNIGEMDKYLSNISNAQNHLEATDVAYGNLTLIVRRAQELVLAGANDTQSAESREALAKEIEELKNQVGSIANTTFGSKYLFAGTNVTSPPYDAENNAWTGNGQSLILEIGVKTTMEVSSTNNQIFFNEDSNNPGLIQLLEKIATDIISDNDTEVQKDIKLLGTRETQILSERATMGAKINRLQNQGSRMEQIKSNYEVLLSENEDADYAQLIMDLKMSENIYQASLAVGARIIMPSLVDFLR